MKQNAEYGQELARIRTVHSLGSKAVVLYEHYVVLEPKGSACPVRDVSIDVRRVFPRLQMHVSNGGVACFSAYLFGRDHEKVDAFVDRTRAQSDIASAVQSQAVVTGVTIAAQGFSPLASNLACRLEFGMDEVVVLVTRLPETTYSEVATVPLREVRFLRVGGRGAVTSKTGGGWFGGGFGLQGAAEGVLVASALNALTRRSKTTVETIVHLNAGMRELMMVTGEVTPQVLQVRLGAVFLRIDELQARPAASPAALPLASTGLADELRKLATLRDEGMLSEAEFASAKARLLRTS